MVTRLLYSTQPDSNQTVPWTAIRWIHLAGSIACTWMGCMQLYIGFGGSLEAVRDGRRGRSSNQEIVRGMLESIQHPPAWWTDDPESG